VTENESAEGAGDVQKYSTFHAPHVEAQRKAWHRPYADILKGYGTVLDLGCGPGYFLDLLRDRGVPGLGIDIDPAMVRAAKGRGHEAFVGDHTLIGKLEPALLGGVHLSHVIEHLWGDEAVALLEASYRALRVNGLLVVRTPNWRNAGVRHHVFWMDHTHKRPYPVELLEKLMTDIGFRIAAMGSEATEFEDIYIIGARQA
jgi:SAM-dependent methyltransferase